MTLRELESNPKFKDLTWEQQKLARYDLMLQAAGGLEGLNALPSRARFELISSVLDRDPVFSDPLVAGNYLDIIRKAKGDSSPDKEEATRQIKSIALTTGLGSSGIFKTMMNTVGGLAQGIAGVTPGEEMTWEALYGKDARKMVEHSRELLKPGDQRAVDSLTKWGQAGAIGLDFLAGRAITAGLPTKLASAPFKELAATRTTTRLGTWLAGKIAPMVIENTGGGLVGVVREQLLRDPGQEVRFKNIAADFGQYAALDYLIGGALSAVGLGAKAVWLTFRGVDKGLDALSPAMKAKKIEQFVRGELDISTFGELSEATQDRLMHARSVQKFAGDPELLATSPLAQSTIMAHNTGMFMRQLDDGSYRLRSMADTRASKVYQDLFQANKAIAAQVDRVAAKLEDPTELVQWLSDRGPISGMVENYKFQREAYQSASPLRIASQAYRNTISPGELSADLVRFQELEKAGKVQLVDTFRVSPDDLKQAALPLMKAQGDGLNNGLVVLRKIAGMEDFKAVRAMAKSRAGRINPNEWAFNKLASEGFDAVMLPDRQLVHLFPETIRIEGAVNPRTGKLGTMNINYKKAEVFNPAARASIKQDILNLTPGRFTKSKETIAEALVAMGPGDVDPEKVKGLVEGLMASGRKNLPNVTVTLDDTIESLKEMRVRIIETPTETKVIVPSLIAGPETFRVFSKNLLEAVERRTTKSLREVSTLKFPQAGKVAGQLEGTMKVLPNAPPEIQLDWIKRVAKGAGAEVERLPGGKYSVSQAGGGQRVYQSMDALAKSMYFRAMTEESLGVQLAAAGYRMTKEKGLLVVRGKTGKVWAGATPEELLERMGWSPKRLNALYAPKVAVSKTGATLTLEGEAVVGSGSKLRTYLDSFQSYLEAETNRVAYRSPKGVIAEVGKGRYEVEIPRFGVVEQFESVGDARRFLEKDWGTFENLQKAASRRGWSLRMEGGNWRVTGPDVNVVARSLDEVGVAMKMSPDPVWAPPILGEEIEGSLALFVKDHPLPVGFEIDRPRFLVPPKGTHVSVPGVSVRTAVAYGTAPMRDFVRLATEDLTNPKNWLKAARIDDLPLSKIQVKGLTEWVSQTTDAGRLAIEKAYRLTGDEIELVTWVKTAAADKTLFRLSKTLSRQSSLAIAEAGKGNALFNNILAPQGKLMNVEKRKGLFYFMGSETDAARMAIAQKFKLTPDDLTVVEDIRKVLGKDKYSGLFAKFGIDPQLFLFDYMPRIRRHLESMKPGEINKIKLNEFLEGVFGKGTVPKELSFWAENQRMLDIANYAMDDDILSVLHKYNSTGHKKLILNDVWKETYEYLDSPVGKKLPVAVHQRMNMYRQQIMGVYTSDAEVMIQDVVARFMRKMGKDGATSLKAGQEFMGKVMSLNYLTTMGWRPWLPIRNLFQVFSTLAPRFGNSSTMRAIREVVGDTDGEIVKVMKNLGIIQDVPPIVHQLAAEQSRLGRLTSGGLKWYKTSDDITRAIAFKTAWNQWDEAVGKMQSGAIRGKERFLEYTQANLLGPETSDMVWDLYQKGKVDEARNLFGFEVTADTMFLYQRAEAPMMMQGLVGKLFGQYGTYSSNFRQNLWKGLRYGTLAQRTAFVGRFAFNSAALYGAFKALGITEKNFLPWSPVGFSGGPLFNLGITAMQATQTDYKGRQARAELGRYMTMFVPGSFQARSLGEFLEETEKGNSYRAFLALLDVPLASE